MYILSPLLIMVTRCFRKRTLVATILRTHQCVPSCSWVNTLRLRQNGPRFADDVFKCIFFNENVWISLKISLKFVPNVPINNIPALVLILASRRPGDKPLSEPMMVSLLTHIWVTRPQWVNIDQYMRTGYTHKMLTNFAQDLWKLAWSCKQWR